MLLKGSPTQILLQIELFIMNVAQIDWKIKFRGEILSFGILGKIEFPLKRTKEACKSSSRHQIRNLEIVW